MERKGRNREMIPASLWVKVGEGLDGGRESEETVAAKSSTSRNKTDSISWMKRGRASSDGR